jgi:hypothetical protein
VQFRLACIISNRLPSSEGPNGTKPHPIIPKAADRDWNNKLTALWRAISMKVKEHCRIRAETGAKRGNQVYRPDAGGAAAATVPQGAAW